jgi:endonuclease/exonuclease/phosphatase (EEP) superfamily protein YafD
VAEQQSGKVGEQEARSPRESLRAGVARRWKWPMRAAVWGGAAGTLFAFACPAMLDRGDAPTVAVTHAACMLRTFGLQCGVGFALLSGLVWLIGLKRLLPGALLLAAVWLTPEALKWRKGDGAGGTLGTERLTVLSVNALFGRSSVEAIAREAKACNADVILLQEYTPGLEGSLRPVLAEYRYRVEMARDDGFGQGVYSRLPLVGEPRVFPAAPFRWSSQPQITVTVRFDGGLVRITDVHLLSPVGLSVIAEQRREAAGLADEVRAALSTRGEDGKRVELVLGGDFNGTTDGHILAPVLETGVIDSWHQAERGRGGTWPMDVPVLSTLGKVRLDNLLHSDGLTCVAAGVGEATGSDHLPTWARYARKR